MIVSARKCGHPDAEFHECPNRNHGTVSVDAPKIMMDFIIKHNGKIAAK